MHFFILTVFFFKPLLDASIFCHNWAKIWFKNSIVATKLFLVMVLNLYLTSAWSKRKSYFVVAVL